MNFKVFLTFLYLRMVYYFHYQKGLVKVMDKTLYLALAWDVLW
ncbi:hypothetical protein [Lentilactobacillus sunkii]|nr:hypothetical protein [Lentilactobacillus sunkii]